MRTDRLDGVGNWLLETKFFGNSGREKVDASGGYYFVRGSLGAGKAYLIQERSSFGKGKERGGHRRVENVSSSVIDSRRSQATEKDLAVARLLRFPCH